jgi:hypothetical protein
MAREAMTTDDSIKTLLRGSTDTVSTTSVLCAQSGTNTATYIYDPPQCLQGHTHRGQAALRNDHHEKCIYPSEYRQERR